MLSALCGLTAAGHRGRRRSLSRNCAAAAALSISSAGLGPAWRLADGNTDDSPKDRLDLYDGKKPRFRPQPRGGSSLFPPAAARPSARASGARVLS